MPGAGKSQLLRHLPGAVLDQPDVAQQREFELEPLGYDAVKHQRSVGAGYFDAVAQLAAGGAASTLALAGSTEDEQFLSEGGSARAAAVRRR